MDHSHSGVREKQLSNYFKNDPPSIFDELSTTINSPSEQRSSMPKDETAYRRDNAEFNEFSNITDDIKNFWLPNISEKKVLIPPAASANELEHDFEDEIAKIVSKHLGENELKHRKVLGVDDVTLDDEGIRTLIAAGCFRSALNLTRRLLSHDGYDTANEHHGYKLFQLWFTRLALLLKLGNYGVLQTETALFNQLNGSGIFCEGYVDKWNGKSESIPCFSFRLFLAEIPIYMGTPQIALDQLSHLYEICDAIKKFFAATNNKLGVDFWTRRVNNVLYSIINCAITMKDYNLVDGILHKMLLESNILREHRRTLFSVWGRIYLHVGDIFEAEQKFSESRRLRDIGSSPDLRDCVDKGLIMVAKNDFPDAYVNFQKALHIQPNNCMVLNNMGVCLLYAGKLKEAIKLFERSIDLNPQQALNESLLVNLSTLYELESSRSMSKKLNLLRLVNRYKPDSNMNLEVCLKLRTVS